MTGIETEHLTGQSGQGYTFNTYPADIRFNDFIPGVYLISRQESDDTIHHVFLGETDNIDICLADHDSQACFDQHGYNRIAFCKNASREIRRAIVEDLLPVLDPVCNRDRNSR